MYPERWQQIERLYRAALEQGVDERGKFIAEACEGDPELRRELEWLMAQDVAATGPLGDAPRETATSLLENASAILREEGPQPNSQDLGPLRHSGTLGEGRLVSGTLLGERYRIVTLVGSGGMGEVYRANDLLLGQTVALKFLPPAARNDEAALKRFRNEVRVARQISHPNVCRVYDIGEANGLVYLSMEYVDGEDLASLLRRVGKLPADTAVEIGRQICAGLAAAHDKGVIHRDLKPANIMLDGKGQVRIADFGLAGVTEHIRDVGSGTPAYMAPEQRAGTEVTARSDIYALGILLHELLTGSMPAQNKGHTELDSSIGSVISRCLETDPQMRPANAMLVAAGMEAPPAITARPSTQSPRARWRWGLVGLSLILSTAAVIWFLARRDGSPSTDREIIPVPLTSYRGQELQPSFSPDGNEIAFMWNGEKQDNFDIYRKQIGTDRPLRLTSDRADDVSPAWSPDGHSIAFVRVLSPARSGIFLIPALGGPERKIVETASAGLQPSIAWSPDSKWLAFSDADPESKFTLSGLRPASLFLASLETGEKRRVTSHALRSAVDAAPAFAPDGRALAFVRISPSPLSDLYLIPFSSGYVPAAEPRRLTFLNRFATSPAWTPDQKELVFASGSWENVRLWRVAVSGRQAPSRLDFAGDHTNHPAISRQGRLAFSQTSTDVNIWRTDLSEAGGKAGPPRSIIASTHTDINPQFSPDGKRIAFCSDRSGSMEVWICDRDGSQAVQLTSMGAAVTGSPRWSPDGTHIVYDSNREGQFEVYVVSASGGIPQRMTNHPAIDGAASWSRDGRWIYFMSNRSGRRQIWKMPAPGGEAVQVTKHGGHVSFESPDGAFLYISGSASTGDRIGLSGLRRMAVEAGEETPVLPSVTFLNFALVREGIYFIPRADAEGHYAIHFFSFASGRSREILSLGNTLSTGLSVSPEGRSLLYTRTETDNSDLLLVDHFR